MFRAGRPMTSVMALDAPPVVVARQPVFDRRRHLVGYELLFRALDPTRALVVDHERASAHVLVTALADIGIGPLSSGLWAGLNVTRQFLLDVDPLPFAPGEVVLELLENQLVDAALLDRCAELAAQGHMIGLDDFAYSDATAPLLEHARVVKLDVREHGIEGLPAQILAIRRAGFSGSLLAEKIETQTEHDACLRLGFDYFQGELFAHPQLVSGHALQTSSLQALHAAATLTDDELGFEALEELVSRDPGLAMRLLRLLNSAAFPLRRRVETVHDALVMLGVRTVRQWAMLIVLAGLPSTRDELLPNALVRARLLEILAGLRGDPTPAGAFVVGLFSLADEMLGVPMDEALGDLPLAEEHLAALLRREGPNGRALAAVVAHERGEPWAPADAGVPVERFAAAYAEALVWAFEAEPGLKAA